MTAAVEHIKKEIRSLGPDEIEALLRDLQNEYVLPPVDDEAASIEAEWDAEIDRRMQDVLEGRVELISGEEADRQTDALFARLGISRPVYRP